MFKSIECWVCGGELFNNLVGDTVTSIECKDCGRQYEYEKAVDLIKIVQNSNK